MVMKNSEYRNSFKPTFDIHVKAYEQNLDFRTARKSAEFHHNPSAFAWDAQSWEKGSQTSVIEEPRPGTAPSFKYKHKLFNKMYEENQLHNTAPMPCPVHNVDNKNESIADVLTLPLSPSSEIIENDLQAQQALQQQSSGSVCVVQERTPNNKKPRKPQQPVISKKSAVRPSTAPSKPKHAVASPREDLTARAPFVLYGSKDKEFLISGLRTYNVRASTDIYTSALRAQKCRQAEKDKRVKSAPVVRRKPMTFDQRMDKQTSCWQTEYKGHFVNYDKAEYQRGLSSVMSVRRNIVDP